MANTDPFSLTEAAIISTLTAFADFNTLVPTDNIVQLTGEDRKSFDDGPKFKNRPQVRVVPELGSATHLCSSGHELGMIWRIQIRLGDERQREQFYPTMWAIFRAMAASEEPDSTVRTQTWNSKAFVHFCRMAQFETSYDVDKLVGGWITAWAYDVRMHFTSDDLPPA
jgi:hypothetical protein